MPVSEAKKKASKKYQKKNYDRVNILLPKGTKEEIKNTGESVNGFVNKAVKDRLYKLSKNIDM